ncbi:MAG: peptide-methionine (S)-S-oxide reductase MsrA, partial [Deltaproteobacteria bacterium]
MNLFFQRKPQMVSGTEALPGRASEIPTAATHFVYHTPLTKDVPPGHEVAIFAMGCFWGVERLFWDLPGVSMTMVGYAGGFTPNATYKEVCSGQTGHTEVVRVTYDPARISYGELLKVFWENHDPTQGLRQGNDVGSQYRSAIYWTTPAQEAEAKASAVDYGARLKAAGFGAVTSELAQAPAFYHAEDYHQQYLAKVPDGYCGLAGTGVT